MDTFYNEYKNLKFKIRKEGIASCGTEIDEMLMKYTEPQHYGLILLKKAQFERVMGNIKNAEQYYLEIQNNSYGDVVLFATRDLFRLYIDQKRINEAENLLGLLEFIDNEDSYLFQKSLLLRSKNKYLDSSKLLSKLIRKSDKSEDMRLLYDYLIEIDKYYWDDFKRNNYRSIKEIIRKLNSNTNGERKIKHVLRLAELEQINFNYSEALKLYRTLITNKDNQIRSKALVGICKIYLLLGNKDLLNSVEFEELKACQSTDAIYLIAQVYCANGNYEQAMTTLNSIPSNYRIIYEKARIFKAQNNNDAALILFNECYEKSENYTLRTASLFSIISIYIDLKDYEKAFELVNKNKDILINLDKNYYYQLYAFLCKKFDIQYDKTVYNSYSVSQILDYNFDFACERMKKYIHQFKDVIGFDGDISELMNDISTKLTSKTYFNNTFFDVYNVMYEGKDGQSALIKAYVIPDTKDIVTCFPSKESAFILEDMNAEMSKQKVIRKSQIDKFNERYGLKRD